MDERKKDQDTQKEESEDLGTAELRKVAGGLSLDVQGYCDPNGQVQTGPGSDAPGWHYDSGTKKCLPTSSM